MGIIKCFLLVFDNEGRIIFLVIFFVCVFVYAFLFFHILLVSAVVVMFNVL